MLRPVEDTLPHEGALSAVVPSCVVEKKITNALENSRSSKMHPVPLPRLSAQKISDLVAHVKRNGVQPAPLAAAAANDSRQHRAEPEARAKLECKGIKAPTSEPRRPPNVAPPAWPTPADYEEDDARALEKVAAQEPWQTVPTRGRRSRKPVADATEPTTDATGDVSSRVVPPNAPAVLGGERRRSQRTRARASRTAEQLWVAAVACTVEMPKLGAIHESRRRMGYAIVLGSIALAATALLSGPAAPLLTCWASPVCTHVSTKPDCEALTRNTTRCVGSLPKQLALWAGGNAVPRTTRGDSAHAIDALDATSDLRCGNCRVLATELHASTCVEGIVIMQSAFPGTWPGGAVPQGVAAAAVVPKVPPSTGAPSTFRCRLPSSPRGHAISALLRRSRADLSYGSSEARRRERVRRPGALGDYGRPK